MNLYLRTNRLLWDSRVPIHARSRFYNLAGFMAGRTSLGKIEISELGDVTGKSLLHMQCHFGMDTLSWARRGAIVTGIDFSPEAIKFARSLAVDLGLNARFVCSDVAKLPRLLKGKFDIVFTSYGVLNWLPDLRRWASAISDYLKPDGVFYMVEFHPIVSVFEDSSNMRMPRVTGGNSHRKRPIKSRPEGSYAYRDPQSQLKSYQWRYSLSDVISALLGAGLTIQSMREFPFAQNQILPQLIRGADGLWHLPRRHAPLPLMFSVKASKWSPRTTAPRRGEILNKSTPKETRNVNGRRTASRGPRSA